MKTVVFEFEEWERASFEKLAGHDVVFVADPLDAGNAGKFSDAEIITAFIYSDLSRGILEKLPRLKMIATRSTGFDHIDTAYCKEKGIAVCNVPSYGETTVAEHVFALLLTISHRLTDAIDRTRRGDFSQQGLQGFDLFGKTMGVVGTGAIGMRTVEIAKGFGMKVLAFDKMPDEDRAKAVGFDYVAMDDLLARSDVISLHVPGDAGTHHMIGRKEFEKMKPGAVLINTARGTVVDVEALVSALASGKLKAAGLDVLPEEPVIREEAELLRTVLSDQFDMKTLLLDHVLLHMKNVVITPHSAFNTREAVQRILDVTVGNILSFGKGQVRNRAA